MFPQPDDKPLGPAEFLPILLAISPPAGDPLVTSAPAPVDTILPADDRLPFLNDLANGVSTEQLADTITPTLSLFFQEWFKIASPDLLGTEWQRYLGAVTTLTQVKPIAALVSYTGTPLISFLHSRYGLHQA
jgi:ubiquitin conjugation factor E4 B